MLVGMLAPLRAANRVFRALSSVKSFVSDQWKLLCTASVADTVSLVQVGDKIAQVSASFGTDIWEAQNFGQVMYAIKTRNGDVYLKMKRNYGDTAGLMVSVPETHCCLGQISWVPASTGHMSTGILGAPASMLVLSLHRIKGVC